MSSLNLVRVLAFLAVPLAAFLTFMAQPLMGKYLLPWHGGSASTWVTTMVFFQTSLLCGYLLAFFLQGLPLSRQALLVAILAMLAPLVTQVPPLRFGETISAWSVFLSLSFSLFPAILLTTCLGIVLHGWFRQFGGSVPYYLYSISNFGSLFALVSYPLLIEPNIGLSWQSSGFRILLFTLCTLVLCLSSVIWWHTRRQCDQLGSVIPVPGESSASESITLSRKLYWLALSAAPCVVMIGSMRILSAEIGSNPLSWIVPLALYLLSFSITFSGLWRPFLNSLFSVLFIFSLFSWLYFKGFKLIGISYELIGLLVLLLFLATNLAHGMLYLSRPKVRFNIFYVFIAIGGVLGGFFASIIAPTIFSMAYEFPASLFLILGIGTWKLLERSRHIQSKRIFHLVVVAALIFPGLLILWGQILAQRSVFSQLYHLRSIYGQFTIETRFNAINSYSETTMHGKQLLDNAKKQVPTAYYHRGTALGRILTFLQHRSTSLDIGVVGLGVGTLAAYGRENDKIIFWDIDPTSIFIASKIFGFVSDSAAQIDLRLEDGRLGLKKSSETFDLIVIDAFTGDSIPAHLMTREAILTFLNRVPNGVLAIHVTNRYLNLFPVLASHAKDLKMDAVWVRAVPDQSVISSEGAAPSNYFFYLPNSGPLNAKELQQMFADSYEHFTYILKSAEDLEQSESIEWTDDRHAILDAMNKLW